VKKLAVFIVLLFAVLYGRAQSYLEFVENKGQWDKAIKFQANMGTGLIALQADGYRVMLYHPDDLAKVNPHPEHDHSGNGGGGDRTEEIKKVTTAANNAASAKSSGASAANIFRSHVYQIKFLNANPRALLVPEKAQNTYNNYIQGDDPSKWVGNCKIYQAITYKDIYPNIDIRYYTSNGTLKYDIIVHPGGDLSNVAFYVDGANGLQVKDGALMIKNSIGDVKEMPPYSYQIGGDKKTEVSCSYEVRGNIVRFKLNGDYDKKQILIIDPDVVFWGYSGSTADNWGFTATYDGSGNFYAGGTVFQGGSFPISNGAFQQSFQGGTAVGGVPGVDIGIIKFDATGANRLYATYIGGSGNEQPHSLVADAQGNLFIAGRTTSQNYPLQGGLQRVGDGGDADIIITKLNPTGTGLLSSVRIGGRGVDGVNIRANYDGTLEPISIRRNYGDDARSEIILDAAGNVILAGVTQSTDFPVSANAFQRTPALPTPTANNQNPFYQDGVLIKMTGDLNSVIFTSFLGGTGDDAAFVVAVHPLNGNIYVGGATASTDFPGNKTGVVNPTNQGNIDGYVAVVSPDGSTLIRSSYFGRAGIDVIYGLQFDRQGFPYITGTALQPWTTINSPFNANGNQANGRQFISKLNDDLSSFLYSANFGTGTGTASNISPTAFLVDRCGNTYVSGWGGVMGTYPSAGTRGLITTGTTQIRNTTDNSDLYFFVLERDARSVLYATFFGSVETVNNLVIGDHVDGGTSRFDQNGTIYQSICSCGGTQGGTTIPGTAGVWSRNNMSRNSSRCNILAIKMAINLAGVGAGLQASINGVVRDTAGCVPLTAEFRDTLAQGTAYYWNFGDGSPEIRTTVPNISHTFNNIGIYRVRLISVDSSTCNLADTAFITMRVRADEAILSFTGTKLPPCASTEYEFNNTSIAPAGKPFTNQSFRWDFGDGTTQLAGGGIVRHTYATGGTYDVKLVLVDTNYCNHPDSVVQQFRISPNVVSRFTVPTPACAPYTAVFTNTSLAGQQFQWDFGDGGTSTQTNPIHLYATPGTYTVRLIAIDNATCNLRDTSFQTIEVSGSPTAGYTYSPNPTEANTPVTFLNTSTGGTNYKWTFGDGDSLITVQRDTLVAHQYIRSGTYNACVIAFNNTGCSDTSCQAITVTVNDLVDVPNAFSPNGDGRNDRIFVRGFGIAKMTWRIYNRWGVEVYTSTNVNEGWDGTYKGRIQPQEVYHYILQIEFANGDRTTKKGDITLLR
jgi:gliding motility-associated-like protein